MVSTRTHRKAWRIQGPLSVAEIDYARNLCLKRLQSECYGNEIDLLSNGKVLPAKHKLLPLAPFVGDDGLLRVGGRL